MMESCEHTSDGHYGIGRRWDYYSGIVNTPLPAINTLVQPKIVVIVLLTNIPRTVFQTEQQEIVKAVLTYQGIV